MTQPQAQSAPSSSAQASTSYLAPVPPPPKKKQSKKSKPAAATNPNDEHDLPNFLKGGSIGLAYGDPPVPGWASAGGGQRRVLPEFVLPFKLPTVVKKDGTGGVAIEGTRRAKDGSESGDEEAEEDENESSSEDSETDEDDESQPERRLFRAKRKERKAHQRTLLLTQSLRQSRVNHLSALLPPYSHRTRAGTHYPASVSTSQLHGIDPSVQGSHILTSLGRFHVVMGPHSFAKTRLWEMRKEAGPSFPSMARRTPPPSDRDVQGSPSGSKSSQTSTSKGSSSKGKQAANTGSSAQSAQPQPPVAATTVDPNLVTRVNERAAKNAQLRELLQVTARGAATAEQLKALGEVIQDVTREMEREGLRVQPPQPIRPPPPPPASQRSSDADASKQGSGSRSSAQGPSRQATAREMDSRQASTSSALSPPILILEFRENSSLRSYIPVWNSLVSRRKVKRPQTEEEEGVADKELTEEPKPAVLINAVQVAFQFLVPHRSAADQAVVGAQYPMTIKIEGQDPNGFLWDAAGRVPGITTFGEDGREITAEEAASRTKEDQEAISQRKQTIALAIANLPPPLYLDLSGELPRSLEDHLTDRFAPQIQVHHARPSAKRRSNQQDLDVVHDMTTYEDSFDLSGGPSLASDRPSSSTGPPKPRKKRNVATHNPDGTLKRCNACGTNTTPMWRRGPDGPSTLCNACGARWKTGRLGMPIGRGRGGRGTSSYVGDESGDVTLAFVQEEGGGEQEGEMAVRDEASVAGPSITDDVEMSMEAHTTGS